MLNHVVLYHDELQCGIAFYFVLCIVCFISFVLFVVCALYCLICLFCVVGVASRVHGDFFAEGFGEAIWGVRAFCADASHLSIGIFFL